MEIFCCESENCEVCKIQYLSFPPPPVFWLLRRGPHYSIIFLVPPTVQYSFAKLSDEEVTFTLLLFLLLPDFTNAVFTYIHNNLPYLFTPVFLTFLTITFISKLNPKHFTSLSESATSQLSTVDPCSSFLSYTLLQLRLFLRELFSSCNTCSSWQGCSTVLPGLHKPQTEFRRLK